MFLGLDHLGSRICGRFPSAPCSNSKGLASPNGRDYGETLTHPCYTESTSPWMCR